MKQAIRSVPGIDGSANMMVRLLGNPGRWVQSRSAAGVADRIIALGGRASFCKVGLGGCDAGGESCSRGGRTSYAAEGGRRVNKTGGCGWAGGGRADGHLGQLGGRSQACSRVERVLSKAAAVLVGSGGLAALGWEWAA